MPTTTTTYSFNKPVVGADEDDWGGYLNGNWDSVDDLLDGTTPVTGIDINSGTLDGVTIGGTTAGAGTFTTLTATGATTLAGASTSADITFGDNDKAIFGAGSDLEVYHDGANSRILENGTGFLAIGTNGGEISLRGDSFNDYMLKAEQNSAVTLYHNALPKLATTSTGVDITGTLTSDGLIFDAADFVNITAKESLAITIDSDNNQASRNFSIYNDGTSQALFRAFDTGDISFYEDTGTTAKFFWDASAESLGIGTSSPSDKVEILDGALMLKASSASGYPNLKFQNGSKRYDVQIDGSTQAFRIVDSTASSTRMVIDSSGRVGIGTSSPDTTTLLTVDGAMTLLGQNSGHGASRLKLGQDTTAISQIRFYGADNSTPGILQFTGSSADGTVGGERMRLDSSGNVGIGTSSPSSTFRTSIYGDGSSIIGGVEFRNAAAGGSTFTIGHSSATSPSATLNVTDAANLIFKTSNTEAMRIDSSGELLIGKTVASVATVGTRIDSVGGGYFTYSNGMPMQLYRRSSDGDILGLYRDTSKVGSIGTSGGTIVIDSGTAYSGLGFDQYAVYPRHSGASSDNLIDLGYIATRFDDIYATNGTIQTSDQNEKQDIAELSDAEQRVAVAAKGLLRKFRWKDAVAKKGDEARTHFGIIAQDLQAAFAAEGLDAGDYAMFIHTTWTDEETGEERSRMGVRYSELLAFIIAAI